MNEDKKYTFEIEGLHCRSCVLLTESKMGELDGIKKVKTDLANGTITIWGNFENDSENSLVLKMNEILKPHGYKILEKTEAKNSKPVNWSEFKTALPIAGAFIAFFILIQKLGIVNIISVEEVSFAGAFLVGIVASLSTCMAVVGGLTLSVSATFAKEGDKTKPQILFHIGRLISFFVLGGVLGVAGEFFAMGTISTFVLGIIVGLVMFILGINLLDIWHWSKKMHISMPKFVSHNALKISKLNHSLTPFLVGFVTFFLPCGFTQSMQIYTLTSGGFVAGAFVMFAFALGTLPVLALVSFSSFSIKDSKYAGIFWKSAGLVVIAFAVINIINSLAIVGVIPPIINF